MIQLHTILHIPSSVINYGCETKTFRNMLHGRHGVKVILKTFLSQKLHTFEHLAYTRQHPEGIGSTNATSGASAFAIL